MSGEHSRAPAEFTHSLYDQFPDLLHPDKLVAAEDVHTQVDRREIQHGVYAWWFDADLPLVPREGCLRRGDYDMLYIGIAPPSRTGEKAGRVTPIKRRLLRNHLRGSIRTSTLRQTLAALLTGRMGFICSRDARRKPLMRKEDEAWLSEWMVEHARLSFIHTADPWGLEEALVRNGPPLPLNLSMSQHPFRKTLSVMRSQLGRDAGEPRTRG